MRYPPRSTDRRVLEALRMKCEGATWREIAEKLGYANWISAQGACMNVRKADADESGEDIEGAYW